MSVRCSHCGEELMGAVNRCWRCGRAFTATPTVSAAPPVRRNPIDGPLDVPPWIAASLVVAQIVEPSETSGDAPVMAEVSGEATAAVAVAGAAVRRGSPFSDSHVPSRVAGFKRRVTTAFQSVVAAVKRRFQKITTDRTAKSAADSSDEEGMSIPTVASVIGLILGVISLALLGFPLLAALLGVLGMAFAAVGFAGRSFGIVIVALLVCCLSTGIAAYRFGMQTYEDMYGPSESSEEFEPEYQPPTD